MPWWKNIFGAGEPSRVDEALKQFQNRGNVETEKEIKAKSGEGIEDITAAGYGFQGISSSMNNFYSRFLSGKYENEIKRIQEYRTMATYPEIADVLEDACNEALQEDENGKVLTLQITDDALSRNSNITKNLHDEFNRLFYERLNIDSILWDYFFTYLIDGRVYYERIINEKKQKEGIVGLKKLPSESMDFNYDPKTGRIDRFIQYLKARPAQMPKDFDDNKDPNIIVFFPQQVGFINSGMYGATKKQILGYLEKARVPYNQLKLLETSVIIYRIVRSPSRLVFKVDTGNMPIDKAMKFVEAVKSKMTKKQTFDSSTGRLSNDPNVMCIRHNTEIPLLDGRNLSLDQIISEFNNGKENWVYSVNKKTGTIEPGKIINAKITRPNEQLIRVHFDNKTFVDTTLDHKFIKRDGSDCRADELKVGDSMMPLYKRMCKIHPYSKLTYEQIYHPQKNSWEFTHGMVAHNIFGSRNVGEIVHHRDFNKFNNSPSNLVYMNKADHSFYHSEKVKNLWKTDREKMLDAVRRGRITMSNDPIRLKKMSDKIKENWKNNHDQYSTTIKNGINKWLENDENRKKHSEWTIRTNIEQNKVAKMQQRLNEPEIREKQKNAARKSKIEWFENGENRDNFSKLKSIKIDNIVFKYICDEFMKSPQRPNGDILSNRLNNNQEFKTYLIDLNKDRCPTTSFKIYRKMLEGWIPKFGFKNYRDFRKNYGLNHKIVKIEILIERDDCGCITVEGNHNFAVSQNGIAQVFVNNSILENFWLPVNSDGRGSSIDELNGDSKGFTELDDIYYFSKKLYRALKYPLSRVSADHENRSRRFFIYFRGCRGYSP